MYRLTAMIFLVICCTISATACRETAEAFDESNDIIVRNTAEGDLWIKVDDSEYGRVDNDGIAEVVFEDDTNGVHTISAYRDSAYEELHCEVETYYLDDGEDFYWYLFANESFGGSREGDC